MTAAMNDAVITEKLGNTLRDIGIPPRPDILDRINSEMRKDEPDFKQLGIIIGSDVGLSAGLIALANSPYFGARGRARSINDALMLLGLSVASRAIAGLVIRKQFPSSPSLVRFWDASAAIARISGWLAQNLDGIKSRAEDAYTFGLFRDCGIAVLMKRFPEYTEVLKKANKEALLSFTAVEETSYPTNHAVVGCLLAQSWWLPEEICLSIRHHHEYPPATQLNSATLDMIAITQFAEYLFQRHSGHSATSEWNKAMTFCLSRLKLEEKDIEAILKRTAELVKSDV